MSNNNVEANRPAPLRTRSLTEAQLEVKEVQEAPWWDISAAMVRPPWLASPHVPRL